MKNKKTIIIIVIVIVAIIILSILGFKFYEKYKVKKENKEYFKNISYKVSNKFEYDYYSHSRFYHYYKDNIWCDYDISIFDLYGSKLYKDGKDYLEKTVYVGLKEKASDIEKKNINGDNWYTINIKKSGDIRYEYAILKNDRIYKMEYSITDYQKGDSSKTNDFCLKQHDKIISTVKLK